MGCIVEFSESLLQFEFNSKGNRQKILVSDRGPRVDRLNVTVRDFLGYVLNNNGLDWAFSMDILSLN